jgi:Pyruvate/2-oxoacid:ferredoxin oxidoreductase delta subunit
LACVAVTDADIIAPVVDYSEAYPNGKPEVLAEVTVAQLKSGEIALNGKKIFTAGLSSYARAQEAARILKEGIETGGFLLTEPLAPLPGPDSGYVFNPCKNGPIEVRWHKERCIHCTACTGPCTTQALAVADRDGMRVSFDQERCIACELCLPVCPYQAVEILF